MKIAENTARILSKIPIPDEVAVVHRQAAIVDIGSCTTRVGFAGDDAPRLDKPTCVVKGGEGDALCLSAAYAQRAEMDVTPVVSRGEVCDWEAMEQLLQHLAGLLQLDAKDTHTPLLLTEKALIPRAQRQRLAEILIERHAVDALHFAPSPVLALYAAGLCSGVSVEMGYDVTHVVPVFQGYPLFHAAHALHLGGLACTMYMMQSGPALPDMVHPAHRFDVWKHLKEKYCAACPSALAFAELHSEKEDNDVVRHRLPDGTVIALGRKRFVPAEMFFDPTERPDSVNYEDQSLVEHEEELLTTATPHGLQDLIVDSVGKCDADLHIPFYDALLCSGGCSLLQSLPDRLATELYMLNIGQPSIIAPTERRQAAFVGGSILASLPTFQEMWVTKADYDEFGSSAVLRRCF